MLNWYETDIVNVEYVQSNVDMKQCDDYDKMGTILTRKKLEHSYSLLSDVGNLIWQFFLTGNFLVLKALTGELLLHRHWVSFTNFMTP